ncbi:acetyltransferase [Gramella sp. BOM4]|nr:acetyltransferase [Christiangramia bathymodioli]
MRNNLIVYGIGKYAEYVSYVFQEDSNYEVIGYTIEDHLYNTDLQNDKPLVPFSEIDNSFPPNDNSLFIAVGNNQVRSRIFNRALELGYCLPSYISTQCRKWNNLKVGKNSFIDEGCVLQPFVEIGNNCVLFTSNIGHHTKIYDHSLMSGAKTGGNVRIGEFSYIGLNASIKQNVRIGKNSIISMNSAIEHDTEENSVYSNKGTQKRNIDSLSLGNRFLK